MKKVSRNKVSNVTDFTLTEKKLHAHPKIVREHIL